MNTTTYIDESGATGDYVRMNEEDKDTFKAILERISWDENGFPMLNWIQGEPVDEYGYHLTIESAVSGIEVIIDAIDFYGIFDCLEPAIAPIDMDEAKELHEQLLELKNKYGTKNKAILMPHHKILED